MAVDFTEALTRLRSQRQAVAGRQPSRNEVAGVVEGLAGTAEQRLERRSLQASRDEQLRLQAEQLQQQKYVTEQELMAARKAEKEEIRRGRVVGGVAGAGAGIAAGGALALGAAGAAEAGIGGLLAAGLSNPFTAPLAIGGAILGIVSGGSWLCTKASTFFDFTDDEYKTLSSFKKYALKAHPEETRFYLKNGPDLTKAIFDSEEDETEFYRKLKEEMLDIVISHFGAGDKEAAFNVYKEKTTHLFQTHLPELKDEIAQILKGETNGK